MQYPTVLVCGLARCGTSMVMRMLHAGGMPVYADNLASYEANALSGPVSIQELLPKVAGRAVKLLDPHLDYGWPVDPPADVKVIWLDRDAAEQAKSQVKMIRHMGGFSIPKSAWREIERGLWNDRPKARAALKSIGCPVLTYRFEDILRDPKMFATLLAEWLHCPALDTAAMAAVVQHRSPYCAADMAMEEWLVETEPERQEARL